LFSGSGGIVTAQPISASKTEPRLGSLNRN